MACRRAFDGFAFADCGIVGVYRNDSCKAFLACLGKAQDQGAVLDVHIVRAHRYAVLVEGPVACAPAGIVEGVEVIRPGESEVRAVFANARCVGVNLHPVDVLMDRKNGVVPFTDPAGHFRRPQVKAEALFADQGCNLILGVVRIGHRFANLHSVDEPSDVIRSPFHAVGVVAFVGVARKIVMLFARNLLGGITGDDVGLELVRCLTILYVTDITNFCTGRARPSLVAL